MQVYRGVDIGTAKPSREERQRRPHHLVDCADPEERFSAGRYRELAVRVVDDILARRRVPVVVGGTGLYVRALVDGMFDGPRRDDGIRHRIEGLATEELRRRLEEADPETARRTLPGNRRRMVRALEVYEASGRPISAWQAEETRPLDAACVWVGLARPREELYARIEERTDRMVRDGLVEEARGLLERAKDRALPALQGLGYREAFDHLDGRISSLEEMTEAIRRNTRRFARRQIAWFSRDERIRWFHPDRVEAVRRYLEEAVPEVLS
jgi:tRNA dimethylallyltransferase